MWWCVNERFPYCKALEGLGFAVTWKRPAVRARCTRCTSTAEGGMFYTFVVRLRFFFFVVGGDALRLHFPPVCGRGTARDGLRTEGRVGSERKLHSSPVHNVAVWACIFVSFCAEKKRKALVRHQLPPRTSKATAFHSVWKKRGGKKIGEGKKLEPQVSEWERKEGLKAALSINPARFLLAWPRGYKLILLRFGFPQCLPPERIIKVALQKAGSSPWHIYQEQESY